MSDLSLNDAAAASAAAAAVTAAAAPSLVCAAAVAVAAAASGVGLLVVAGRVQSALVAASEADPGAFAKEIGLKNEKRKNIFISFFG